MYVAPTDAPSAVRPLTHRRPHHRRPPRRRQNLSMRRRPLANQLISKGEGSSRRIDYDPARMARNTLYVLRIDCLGCGRHRDATWLERSQGHAPVRATVGHRDANDSAS